VITSTRALGVLRFYTVAIEMDFKRKRKTPRSTRSPVLVLALVSCAVEFSILLKFQS
jgi:hypothetical protein